MNFLFFKEWDFYYIPKTDYSPKWINYKDKLKKLYGSECISPKQRINDYQECRTNVNWKNGCKDCNGSGWALLLKIGGSYCWRNVSKCSSGLYENGSMCYNPDSACKPEMITDQDGYHCRNKWNFRDLNVYQVNDSYSTCSCTGSCYHGAIQVSSYDPKVFESLGGVGSTKLIKSVKLVCQSNTLYCDEMEKAFVVTVNLTKLTSWDLFDKLQTNLETNSITSYGQISYLNFIGYNIVKFYLMMNVENAQRFEPEANYFKSYVPLFLVFKKRTDTGLIRSTVTTSTSRDYSLSFYYKPNSTETSSKDVYFQYTLDKTYATLSGGAVPQSNLTFKTIGKQGMFLVKPTQHCIKFDNDPVNYKDGETIAYLVYYNMSDLKDQGRNNIINELKEKFLSNVNISTSPEYLGWNEYVYYNHILPNLCYEIENNSDNCNEIMYYDASPPVLVTQKCSLLTSKRFPDCKTYLMTNIGSKQPTANQTRTYDKLDTKQLSFCNRSNPPLECQCYNRESSTAYKSFATAGAIDSRVNVGCWYKPCMDDDSSNILIESKFRDDNVNKNCPDYVCQNIITVMNRPENSVQFDNLNLRTSCTSTTTRKPKTTSIPTTITIPPNVEEEKDKEEENPYPYIVEEDTTTPLPSEEAKEQKDNIKPVSLNEYYTYIAVLAVVLIVLTIATILFLKKSIETGLSLVNVFLTFILLVLTCLVAYVLSTYIRLVLAILK